MKQSSRLKRCNNICVCVCVADEAQVESCAAHPAVDFNETISPVNNRRR